MSKRQDLSKIYVHLSGALLDEFMATFLDNAKLAPAQVKHQELERSKGGSPLRSKCPFCGDDTLLMRRNQITFNLENEDQCINCGRRVIYIDIEDSYLLIYK